MKHRNQFSKTILFRWKGRSKSRGFSLIELLVAIGIVVILASLAFSAITKARESAASAKCVGNVRSLMVAYQTWYNDIDRRLPRVDEPESKIPYATYLLPYLGGKELRCPLMSGTAEVASNYGFRYAINDGPRRYYSLRPITEYAHRTVMASEMYSMAEGFYSPTHMTNTMNGSSGRRPQVHSGGMNLGFWDGSVRNVKPVTDPVTGKGNWNLPPILGTKDEGYFYNVSHFSNFKSGKW